MTRGLDIAIQFAIQNQLDPVDIPDLGVNLAFNTYEFCFRVTIEVICAHNAYSLNKKEYAIFGYVEALGKTK